MESPGECSQHSRGGVLETGGVYAITTLTNETRGVNRIIDTLVSVGTHFTLCGKRGNPKAVIWDDYLHRKPSSAQVINHLRSDKPIGIVPYSCDSAVVDVDSGDYRRIADRHKPYLIYPSTSGFPKAHLWYRVKEAPTQLTFDWLDCSGEIISTNHVAFPNPTINLVSLYNAFLDSSNSLYRLPPIPPIPPGLLTVTLITLYISIRTA